MPGMGERDLGTCLCHGSVGWESRTSTCFCERFRAGYNSCV